MIMTVDRIKEIQAETAYPNSISVQQALLKVWNEVSKIKRGSKMQRTKLTFEMINLDDDYIVDPNSIFINGWLPNWQMLDEFLFKKEDSNLPELIESMESGKMYQVELEIWVDSDDYRHWIDFKVLDSGLV